MTTDAILAAKTLYAQTEEFNRIPGNLNFKKDEAFYVSVGDQLRFISEELNETLDAYAQADAVELLDGAVDCFVTVAGLLQKLEAKGFNVTEAMKRVGKNNLEKYPVDNTIACQTIEHYEENGIPVVVGFDEQSGVFIIKRKSDGKVLKPLGYSKVILNDLVPERFLNN